MNAIELHMLLMKGLAALVSQSKQDIFHHQHNEDEDDDKFGTGGGLPRQVEGK